MPQPDAGNRDPNYDRGYYGDNNEAVFEDVKKESPYYEAVSLALQRKWLDAADKKLEPDSLLSREELAVSLTHMLGYDKLAAYLGKDDKLLSFVDKVAIKEKGAVAIVERLGLMNGTGSAFRPQGKVTRAQAAAVIMRLVYLQGKTDQTIGDYRY